MSEDSSSRNEQNERFNEEEIRIDGGREDSLSYNNSTDKNNIVDKRNNPISLSLINKILLPIAAILLVVGIYQYINYKVINKRYEKISSESGDVYGKTQELDYNIDIVQVKSNKLVTVDGDEIILKELYKASISLNKTYPSKSDSGNYIILDVKVDKIGSSTGDSYTMAVKKKQADKLFLEGRGGYHLYISDTGETLDEKVGKVKVYDIEAGVVN